MSEASSHAGGTPLIRRSPGCGVGDAEAIQASRWNGTFVDAEGPFRVDFLPSDDIHGSLTAVGDNKTRLKRLALDRGEDGERAIKYYCRIAAPEVWDAPALRQIGESFPRLDDDALPDAEKIPAAYTYLGQFIAHDLSDVGILDGGTTEVRTSALDLDTVFRAGRRAYHSHESWIGDVGIGKGSPVDGPYPGDRDPWVDTARDRSGRPRVPDARNGKNLGVQQIHVAIAKFHQVVAQHYRRSGLKAQESITRRHFQAMVLGDYLWKVIDTATLRDLFDRGRLIVQPGKGRTRSGFLVPIEFAGAAFRVGHSMIRPKYPGWNPDPNDDGLLIHLFENAQLRGRLSVGWDMPWQRNVWEVPSSPQTVAATAIDNYLASSLHAVGAWSFMPAYAKRHPLGPIKSLATLSMARHEPYELASAQELIAIINRSLGGVCEIPLLSGDELVAAAGGDFGSLVEELGFHRRTPLYLYCLLECHKAGGQKMGPLTSRIVAETIHAAVAASRDTVLETGPKAEFAGDPGLATKSDFGLKSMLDIVSQKWKPEP